MGPADDGQDGGAVVWCALGSWPEQEEQVGLGLLIVCVKPYSTWDGDS